jgi:hypothetical protein
MPPAGTSRGRTRPDAPRPGALAAIALALTCVPVSGCAWLPRTRPAREGEPLALASLTVRAPTGAGWRVSRSVDGDARKIVLLQGSGEEGWERRVVISERSDATALPTRETLVELFSGEARDQLGDPQATVTELPASPDPRFGASAVAVALRVEESDAKAGLLVKRVVSTAAIAFAPPARARRSCLIGYEERGRGGRPPQEVLESWRALLEGVELDPAGAPPRRPETARDFPKVVEAGLARRSLTLPRAGFQWTLDRERWIATGGFRGTWGLTAGLTDHLEVGAPGFLRYSLGDPSAVTRPELAIGAGWTGWEHDATRGSTWGAGLSAEARRRIAPALALRGLLLGELLHESRTRRDRLAGGASAGVVWDPHPFASLGLEAGWASRAPGRTEDRIAWVGGRSVPLVTIHFPPLDLGLDGAVAWDGERAGVLGGFSLRLTL